MKKFLSIMLLAVLCSTASGSEAAIISDGVYNIITALNPGKAVDVSGAGRNNGTNIQLWDCTDELQQQFAFTRVSGMWYKIIDQNSGKALDVAGGSTASGSNVHLFEYNGSDAQMWQLENAGGGYYYIRSRLGCYLDVSGGGTGNGNNILVWQFNGSNAQRFRLNPTSPYSFITEGTCSIRSAVNTNYALDAAGGGTANYTNIQLFEANNTSAQKFTVSPVRQGWYRIINSASGRVLDVSGGVRASQVNVQLYDYNASDAQLWRFYRNGSYYFIKNKLGYYLDVQGGTAYNGCNVWVYTGNKSRAQLFSLSTSSQPSPQQSTTTYYVTTKAGLILRNGPSAYNARILTMPYGSAVQVSSISNGWAYVTYSNYKGYCSAAYISTAQPNTDNNNGGTINQYGFAQPVSVYGAYWGSRNSSGYRHDISGGGINGRPVYAIQDGTIHCYQILGNNNSNSRIYVEELKRSVRRSEYYNKLVSYGNVIKFVSNPDSSGRRTKATYAHLSGFAKCMGGNYASFGYGSSSGYVGGTRYNDLGSYQVRRGEIIGYVGTTGNSTGPHLHFELRIGCRSSNPDYNDGTRVSPEKYVGIN